MRVQVEGVLLTAGEDEFEGRVFTRGELLTTDDEDRSEVVRFTGSPEHGTQGLSGVSRMTPLLAVVDVVAKPGRDGNAYLGVRLRSYRLLEALSADRGGEAF